jgi:Rab9 effector protein with kelch motifs
VIFGGRGEKNQCFRDLHALDPVTMTWYQGPQSGGAPLARYNHSATLVGGTRMFVFGGWNGKKYFDDLYFLDLEVMAWTRCDASGPAPSARQGHASVLIGHNLVI